MAVHNDEKYIRRAVGSILEQTYADFEFLIIDDGCTDGTIKIINEYSDPRIRIVKNEKNIGLTRSLNRGLDLARGRYIARMDGDDYSLPERLAKQTAFLDAHPSYGLVGTGYRSIDEADRVLGEASIPESDEELQTALMETNQFAHAAVMYTADAIKTVGKYREFFTYSQDYDLFLRISETYPVYNILEPLLEWRIRMDSASVKYKTLQDRFACIARRCARERRETGSDPIQRGEGDAFRAAALNGFLASSAALKKRTIMAESYFAWACHFFYSGSKRNYSHRLRSVTRLLGKSFMAHPLICLKLISGRIIGAIKRIAGAKTPGERETHNG
jgi:hypothetical protein